jgi:hypothetical protein
MSYLSRCILIDGARYGRVSVYSSMAQRRLMVENTSDINTVYSLRSLQENVGLLQLSSRNEAGLCVCGKMYELANSLRGC